MRTSRPRGIHATIAAVRHEAGELAWFHACGLLSDAVVLAESRKLGKRYDDLMATLGDVGRKRRGKAA